MQRTPRGGRGGGRGRQNTGRGFGGKPSIKHISNKQTAMTKELKFGPFVQGKPPPATYASVKDAIVLHLEKKKMLDVATSIDQMQLVALQPPVRRVSRIVDKDPAVQAELRNEEQAGFDIIFKGDDNEYRKKKIDLEDGLRQAYSIIFDEYCTKIMQDRIQEHPEFKTKIKGNPIELLSAIKVLVYAPRRAQFPLLEWMYSMKRLLLLRQEQDESLSDFYRRFSQEYDTFKALFGTKVFDEATEKLGTYVAAKTTVEKDEIKKESFDAFMSMVMLHGSDKDKYGSLIQTMTTNYSLEKDNYPKTKEKALDALSNHKFDQRYYDKKNRETKPKDFERKKSEDDGGSKKSFAQKPKDHMTCYCCGKKGHAAPECPMKEKIPREEWFIKKAMSNMQGSQEKNDDSEKSDSKPSGGKKAWSGFQQTLEQCYVTSDPSTRYLDDLVHRMNELKDGIILDTGSTIGATIMNPELLSDITLAKVPLEMVTNAGTKKMFKKGKIEGFGEAWYDPDQVANIFGFAKLEDQYRITYDSSIEKAFNVYTKDGIVKFKRNKDGLYIYQPSNEYITDVKRENQHELVLKKDTTDEERVNFLIDTVEENKSGYTQRQFENAKKARKLYHIIGCPTVENFKSILRQNIIRNCPVTVDDVNIAEKIFGPDIGSLKGKSTRSKPNPVKSDLIEIPSELKIKHQDLTLCMDIMFVNGIPMLTSIDRSIRFRALIVLDDRSESAIYNGLYSIFRLYDNAGFRIKRIHCDQEFGTVMDKVSDNLDIDVNLATAGEHVPEAERNNRTIQERIRATYHNLPYAMIPKIMLRYLALISTEQLNMFPAKGGISPYYSPHVILTGKVIDYNKHCQVPFGAYVQANNEPSPTNTNAPRTIDCIYLRPFPNLQGGHELMDLRSGRVITRRRITEVPVTELVIQAVEHMAIQQGLHTLKITGRNTQPLYPADWIEGVEYNQNIDRNDEDYHDEDSIEEEIDNEDLYARIEEEEIADLIENANDGNANDGNQHLGEHLIDHEEEDEEQVPEEQEEVNVIEADGEEANDESDPPADVIDEEKAEDEIEDEAKDEDEEEQIAGVDEPTDPAAEEPVVEPTQEPERITTRSGRTVVRPAKYSNAQYVRVEKKHMILHQTKRNDDRYIEYNEDIAIVAARTIESLNYEVSQKGAAFSQQYILKKGLKKFGDNGKKAATEELDQLHKRNCFEPIDVATMTASEKKKTMESLLFLTQKRDGRVKGRLVYNGKPTRKWLDKEEATAPTASLESIFLTAIVDAKEQRDVMSADIPNAFIQANMPETKDGEERVIMKITGVLVELLLEIDPGKYGSFVVFEKGEKILYVRVLKALYGMLIAALLWYQQFKADLEQVGFKFNDYDPCVANRRVNGKIQTVKFHVDDLKSSHVDSSVNDNFLSWLNHKYGQHGEVKATRGKVHNYLGMTFTYSDEGVTVDMREYISNMIEDFPFDLGNDTAPTPAADDLFTVGDGVYLDRRRSDDLHTFTAKGLFACKRARPDIHTATTFLCTRVKKPQDDD